MRHNHLALLTVLALFIFCACVFGQDHQIAYYRHSGQAALNDLGVTPGQIDPTLTKDKLCDPSFHTATVRHVTQKTKVAVCRAYGQNSGCPGKDYEIDHLISLELGGSDDVTNLWPQPVDKPSLIGFHTKDVVENRAHAAVCKGVITLEQAQHDIATNWYAFGVAQGFLTASGAVK